MKLLSSEIEDDVDWCCLVTKATVDGKELG